MWTSQTAGCRGRYSVDSEYKSGTLLFLWRFTRFFPNKKRILKTQGK